MPAPRPTSRSTEHAFSLIEVIVAVVIMAIVVSSFALAVTSGEKAGQRERVASNKAAIAKKAHEQLQGNVDAQTACGKLWNPQEKAAATSTSAVSYAACTWPSSGTWTLTDDDGRSYQVTATLRPVDDPSDGTGLARALDNGTGGDADFNTRDHIDVTIGVKLDPGSTAGLSAADAANTYTLNGRMGWSSSETLGSARISVCGLDRPDRAMANGRCIAGAAGEDEPAQPLSGVTVRLTPVGGGTTFSATSSGGIASFNGVLPDGTYDVTATAPAGFVLFKVSPKAITIDGTDMQDGTVFMARTGSQFDVCGRIANPDNWGFGWKVTQATVNWGALGAPLHKGLRLAGMNNGWTCVAGGITDPLGYSATKLYRGRYVLEVSELAGSPQDLRVSRIGPCATGNTANWSLYSGTIANPTTLVSPSYRRGLNFDERDGTRTGRLCIEFFATPIAALDCASTDPAPCKLVSRTCVPATCLPTVGCANCDTIPVPSDGSLPWLGPAGVHNGPNESAVACRNKTSATSWNAGSLYYGGGSRRSRSIWQGYQFLGVNSSFHAKHPDGSWNNCVDIAFTATRSMTNTCGSFSLAHPCAGPDPFSLGDCIEAKIAGRVVRGPLWDTFAAGQPSLGVMIGAWDRFIDDPAVDIDWYAYGITAVPYTYGATSGASPSWMNGLPRIRWRVVTGDPVCQSSNVPPDPEDEIIDVVPPKIVDVYKEPGPDDVGDPVWPIPGITSVQPVTSTKSL